MVEYAGYSNDTAKPSQTALTKNVNDVLDYLKDQRAARVIVIGESLGTALASYHTHINNPANLILISPFDSLEHVSQSMYWYYPIHWLLRDKYPSDRWLQRADNVLIVHGTEDNIIPLRFGKELFDKISGAHKTFIEIPNANHDDIFNFDLTKKTLSDILK